MRSVPLTQTAVSDGGLIGKEVNRKAAICYVAFNLCTSCRHCVCGHYVIAQLWAYESELLAVNSLPTNDAHMCHGLSISQ